MSIYQKFKQQVLAEPKSTAVIDGEWAVSFEELDRMTDAVLEKTGYRPGARVGIVMQHGVHMIAAMLAVLKGGAAYVPAEPSLPRPRRDFMMSSAGVTLVIDDAYCRDLRPAEYSLPDRSTDSDPAYILFTSGTSGRPKGVVVENVSVINYTEAFEEEFSIGPSDVMLQCSVCSFDIFVEEVFCSLLNGAALAIPPESVRTGHGEPLARYIDRHRVSVVSGFPYLLAELNKWPRLPETLRLLISGGDVLRHNYIDRLIPQGVRIYNTYGPSETTVCATYQRCDNISPLLDGTYPIGRPVKGVGVKVLDENLKPVPDGGVGEICITGRGVSRGYVSSVPEQSNFITQADGTRMYRSGDMGCMLPDGRLTFLHRRDDQVMILGRRVEPAEVENVLNSSPEVDKGVVRSFLDDHGLAYLVAYFVPAKVKYSLAAIKRKLKSQLADFMIPEYFVAVETIPLTRRGKVDVHALPRVLKESRY